MSTYPYFSVVIPVYNEEENVQPLLSKLTRVLNSLKKKYEIIVIDDGSTDNTLINLKKTLKRNSHVKIIQFRKNFGQTAALTAGFDEAKGTIVITLDGDLQNDPKDIPRLISKLNEGYDVVSGWRKERKDGFILRIIPSRLANAIISYISGVKLHDYGCTLKAYKTEIIKEIKLYGEMHRFIPALTANIGAKVAEIPVNHFPRKKGTSKYGIDRIFRVILDLFTVKFFLSYQTRPLHLFGKIGGILFGFGLFSFLILLYERILHSSPLSNRPLFQISILLLVVGFQFITTGLLAEILVRTYFESQNKKTYRIRNIITE